jgi:hypothetical protein
MTTTTMNIEIDARGRLGLAKLTKPGTWRATKRPDGSVLLEPAQVLTEAEIAVLRNPHVSDAIDATFDGTAETVERDWRK